MKRKLNKKNVAKTLLTIFSVSMLLWFFASYVDVVCHNTKFDEQYKDYASWNFFVIFGDND